MKKFLTISLLALAGLLALPQSAEAGSSSLSITYQSGHSSCGCPIYTQRVVVGWDLPRVLLQTSDQARNAIF
jgi:hypothetical protein